MTLYSTVCLPLTIISYTYRIFINTYFYYHSWMTQWNSQWNSVSNTIIFLSACLRNLNFQILKISFMYLFSHVLRWILKLSRGITHMRKSLSKATFLACSRVIIVSDTIILCHYSAKRVRMTVLIITWKCVVRYFYLLTSAHQVQPIHAFNRVCVCDRSMRSIEKTPRFN